MAGDDLLRRIGARIRQARKELGMTQAELAAARESLLHKAADVLDQLRHDLARAQRWVAAGR